MADSDLTQLQPASQEVLLEECLDELDAALAALERFPQSVLAFALRVHLGNLLRALQVHGIYSSNQLHGFLAGLMREVLEDDLD